MRNVSSADLGLKEGSCALGDVVYMPGDEFPGSTPCETCMCAAGDVKCSRQVCEPRPGCKALHRPDHCCPTYQCECEQEGRVYGNGEKLVDPVDPCRVCYCQGGEVVCRRIACFVRDDCTPRLVPGRCCPEYDNCPLRGVTSLPGLSSPIPSVSAAANDAPAAPLRENIKQEITIKEITPVSEIPVITEVKIKEILPSPSIEVAEYSSSKSPLIPREATSEKSDKEIDSKTDSPSVVEVHFSSPASAPESTLFSGIENKNENAPPSKISLSTQDSMYPSKVPIVASMGVPPVTSEPIPVTTTKAPIIEEEDTFDHNPAFPPLPDDLAVLRNHEDEIVPELVVDNEHVSIHDTLIASASPLSEAEMKDLEPHQPMTSTTKDLLDTTITTKPETPRTSPEITTLQSELRISTEGVNFKESPLLNLRSAIPTEILNAPATVPEKNKEKLDETTTVSEGIILPIITTTETPNIVQDISEKLETSTKIEASTTESHSTPKEIQTIAEETKIDPEEFRTTSEEVKTTPEGIKISSEEISTSEISTISEIVTPVPKLDSTTATRAISEMEGRAKEDEQTTSSIAKSNIATEVTSQTELSSLPIETSDQNPPEESEQTTSDKEVSSTANPLEMISKIPSTSSEVITVSRASSNENTGYENVETTEFILTSFGSSETATDAVELIKISASPEKSASIIEANNNKDNVLTDLINLVSDVAAMSDHTVEPAAIQQTTTTARISDSEELIPVNAGYKSKNKNFNQNSITEIPLKSKNPNTLNKQKIMEIEDDESESVTDAPAPNDKIEPTTRRPIIDNVSDDINIAFNKSAKKDIEIITQSYVPTINRRPPKVVMKKNDEKVATDDSTRMTTETTLYTSLSNETPPTTSAESSASAEMSSPVEPSNPVESSVPNVESEQNVEPQSQDFNLNMTTDRTESTQ
ncbi:unnamed protein product [Arctia plantaginis]|uniref:VWFC domain-containing protein n=1 Tax=Arctia plantaginis TaxID=874455 RepID=A0A8S1B1V4_ARCPL|nr:unnamed protein product [Arctia plantaginis]